MNNIIEFSVKHKESDVEISGYVYVEELDDEHPLNFYNHEGLEVGHYVPSNPYSENTSYDLYMDYETLKTEFQTDDLFLQFLSDFADENKVIDRGDYLLIINDGIELELVNVEKIGDDWGGDNLLFRYNIKNLPVDEDINEKLYYINKRCDFEWEHYESYDNMDFNGHFFEAVYIDKDNQMHKMDDEKLIITDEFICELMESDCVKVVQELLGI